MEERRNEKWGRDVRRVEEDKYEMFVLVDNYICGGSVNI